MTPLCSIIWEAALISHFMIWFLPRVVDVQFPGVVASQWWVDWLYVWNYQITYIQRKLGQCQLQSSAGHQLSPLHIILQGGSKRLALLTVGAWTGSSQRWECLSSDKVGAWVCSDAIKLFNGFGLKRRLRRCPTHPSVWDFPTVIWIPHLSLDIVTQIHCLEAHCLLWDSYVVRRLSATNVSEKLGKYFGHFCDSGGLVSKQ